MEIDLILDQLPIAEAHIDRGEQDISRQRQIVLMLGRRGQDTTLADDLLGRFQDKQVKCVSKRNRLRVDLERLLRTARSLEHDPTRAVDALPASSGVKGRKRPASDDSRS